MSASKAEGEHIQKDDTAKFSFSKNVDVNPLPYDVNNQAQLDQYPAAGRPAESVKHVPLWSRLIWEGGRPFDAFLTVVSAQVGQVILNLPNSMARSGLALGLFFQISIAIISTYTMYLMAVLYQEFKRTKVKQEEWFNDPTGTKRTKVTQYHDVMLTATGRPWLAEFSKWVTVVELIGLCVAQIIAGSSNLYSLYHYIDKRTWALIFGSVLSLMIFVPGMRNMRIFSLFTLFSTTFASLYMVSASFEKGLVPGAQNLPPQSLYDVATSLGNIIFAFGGHCMLLEVVDSMWAPSKFAKAFTWSNVYTTVFLTVPNASFTFLAYPYTAAKFGNAFALYANTPAKGVAIVTMVMDQLSAYGLFVSPLCTMWEKLWRIDAKSLWVRLPSRIPIALLVWLIALAIPFFGVVNNLLGAFCVTFETFVFPVLAFNLYYQGRPDRQAAAFFKPRWLGWTTVLVLNWIIFISFLVFGLGFGGYAAVQGVINAVNTFGFFTACYQCPKKPSSVVSKLRESG